MFYSCIKFCQLFVYIFLFAVIWTNWAPQEPNDWGNGEDCVVMGTHERWNDIVCHSSRTVVCEKDSEFDDDLVPTLGM